MVSDAEQNTIDQAATRLIRLSKVEPFQAESIGVIKKAFSDRGQLAELVNQFQSRAANALSMAIYERTYGILKQ